MERKHVISLVAALSALPGAAGAGTASVAVAANFKPAMVELEAAFEKSGGGDIVIIAGSTGKLYAQIVNGAPFDILLAADALHPQKLADEGFAEGAPFPYAVGRIVLWAPRETHIDASYLARDDAGKVAIANPKLAPYGAAAAEIIDALHLADDFKARLVYGENIGQTFAFVETGAAAAGFIAYAQLLSLPDERRAAHWAPPQNLYTPIRQDGVILKRASENAVAHEFADFLRGPEARKIIRKFGYDLQ